MMLRSQRAINTHRHLRPSRVGPRLTSKVEGGRRVRRPIPFRDVTAGLVLGSWARVRNADESPRVGQHRDYASSHPLTGCGFETVGRVPKMWRAYVGLDGDVSLCREWYGETGAESREDSHDKGNEMSSRTIE